MERIKNGKKIITALLAISCIISGIILAATPSPASHHLKSFGQLDSLIQVQFQESLINPSQVRTTNISVDSVFNRKEFNIKVPSRFSKTLFHIELDQKLGAFELDTPARVHFPSTDMDIYVYHEGTVLRTLRLTTDTELDSLKIESK